MFRILDFLREFVFDQSVARVEKIVIKTKLILEIQRLTYRYCVKVMDPKALEALVMKLLMLG